MPTIEERLSALERENVDIKLRLSTVEGQFEFISGQLRDMQVYMHAKFAQIDQRFDRVEAELRGVKAEVASLRRDLPVIVADVMREVLREERKT